MADSKPCASSTENGVPQGPRFYFGAEEKLWKIWWLWGVPVAWFTSALILGAEATREAGYQGWGNVLDVARLAVYWAWCRMAWRCSGNVDNPLWSPLSKIALAAGFALNVFV